MSTDSEVAAELVSGERITGRIEAGAERRILIRSSILGERLLTLDAIEEIRFNPSAAPASITGRGTQSQKIQPIGQKPEDEEDIRRIFLRQSTVLLAPGQIEVEAAVSYARMGYQATGVRLDLASLPKLKGPVLIHLERKDYRHFAVLKGVRGDRIFLADPSRGNIRMPVQRFAKEWSGIALVLGKKGFGLPQKYPLALDDHQPVPNEILAARRSLFTR